MREETLMIMNQKKKNKQRINRINSPKIYKATQKGNEIAKKYQNRLDEP